MFAWLFSDPLPVGTLAPDFSLPDDSGGLPDSKTKRH
jgi:hypothetical protein